MIPRIIAYRTRHFEFRVPIDEWNEKKIPLPEGAGAQFIAPSNLTAILLEPFYYDWSYETDGQVTYDPTLVYDEKWVGKEIRHFPWCKELFEFLDCLKKQYGWTITESWIPIVGGLPSPLLDDKIRKGGVVAPEEVFFIDPFALPERFGLAFSGYVWKGDLRRVGERGSFWSASEYLADSARNLYFDSGSVVPEDWSRRCAAASVRCVSEPGSLNS
ncbi:hypothetical protein IJI29_00090 [Candidatus Saccharibacteria bacterium]|nr:hypothetical protein [Candidatus Saccharibacteria bacterium]